MTRSLPGRETQESIDSPTAEAVIPCRIWDS